jgi:hypothetical protein
MRAAIRGFLANVALAASSVVLLALVFEFVVFRFILLPSDVPQNAFIDGVVRYRPNQEGVWRIRNEIAAPFSINSQGWNSAHSSYPLERTPGMARVAVIGDSYVEALVVPSDRSFAERLEEMLSNPDAEVFRFGLSGAPLSQYLYVLEKEVLRYSPDLVIVTLVHNDFDESYRFRAGRYTSSFMKLRLEGGAVVEEIPPQPYQPTFTDCPLPVLPEPDLL